MFIRMFAFTFLFFALQPNVTEAKSLRQGMYDTCVDAYNTKFRHLRTGRAMVIGFSGDDTNWSTKCFYAWNFPYSGPAVTRALEDCQKEYPSCGLFATGEGASSPLAGWAQNISDNNGLDPNDNSYSDFVGGLLNGLAGAIGGMNRAAPLPTPLYQYPRSNAPTNSFSGECPGRRPGESVQRCIHR